MKNQWRVLYCAADTDKLRFSPGVKYTVLFAGYTAGKPTIRKIEMRQLIVFLFGIQLQSGRHDRLVKQAVYECNPLRSLVCE